MNVFEPTSRYANVEEATLATATRQIRYKRRRFLPPPGGATILEHTVTQGDRLDLLAARYLGDPTRFWKLCDATGALDPAEIEQPGRVVRVALDTP